MNKAKRVRCMEISLANLDADPLVEMSDSRASAMTRKFGLKEASSRAIEKTRGKLREAMEKEAKNTAISTMRTLTGTKEKMVPPKAERWW